MKAAAMRASRWPARGHAGFWAFVVHRVSGLALALFLPAHFWALGQALQGEAALDGFLHWADRPLVKAAEWLLVVLLASHFAGGLRLLAIEFLPWQDAQRTFMALGAGFALATGLAFAMSLFG
jgi:fumarate reductase subunit D